MKFSFTIKDNVLEKYDAPILGCDTLVTVPDGIMEIADNAFNYIRGINGVELPDSVKSIGEQSFCMCEGMKWIKMPKTLNSLGARAFAHCHRLEKIVIPEGVEVIYENTFYKCETLQEIYLPRSLTRIEPGAFYGCYMLRKYFYAGTQAEWDANVTGGPGKNYLIFLGYDENDKYKINLSDYTIENGVLLGYCGSDTTVFVPDGVHTIAKESFHGLFRDKPMFRIVFPEGLIKIESNAFEFEENLRELVIPKSLTAIAEDATDFLCDGAKKVIYKGTIAEWNAIKENIRIRNITVVECLDGEIKY